MGSIITMHVAAQTGYFNTTYYDENQAIQKEEQTLAANMVMTL